MKISLDKKILGGFIVCCIILLIVAVISFRNGERFLETNQWVNHTHEVLQVLEQVLVNAVEAETGTRGYLLTANDDYLEPFRVSKAALAIHIDKLKLLVSDNPAQSENAKSLEKLSKDHMAQLERYIDQRNRNFDAPNASIAPVESRKILTSMRTLIDGARQTEQKLLLLRKADSERDAQDFNIIFAVLLVTIGLVLTTVYVIITANLTALRRAEQEMADKNWSLAGGRELARIMQGNKSLTELSEAIINHLAVYVRAQLGILYVTGEDNTTLALTGAYAINKGKKDKSFIQMGEGLVGQAANENRMILLTDIPKEHFNIETGLGEVIPKNIIVVPIEFERRVIGVIELGSIYSFTDLQQRYIEFVADSIAISLIASQARQRMMDLLEETQRQAEELEVQQEELKQANEQLHSKTELLERSETELKIQQAKLQMANVELEERANLLGEQKAVLQDAKAEIEHKARELETSSRYKSEFLANMSHELRTPLNSILILSQLLAENKSNRLGDKEKEFAMNIQSSGTSLLNLINEILDLSKIEAGRMELDIEKVPLHRLIQTLSSTFSEFAKVKAINFEVRVDPDLADLVLLTDKERVEQILRNLLSNAFKFTHAEGSVTLLATRPTAAGPHNLTTWPDPTSMIAFIVTDNGIGIPSDKLAIVFEAFQQADGSTKRKYGGTGLGLSISRELAHALGGEIQLASREGEGSTFTLYLPLSFDLIQSVSPEKEVVVKAKEATPLAPLQDSTPASFDIADSQDDRNGINDKDRVILILEDDEKFAQVLLDFTRELGYKGIVAGQGNAGISLARHYKPVAILLDMLLPVMDGHEVLRKIKGDPDLRHIPVQIISAYDKKREGLLLGAFDFIQKPVSLEDLKRMFERIEDFTSTRVKKLLVVEDSEVQNKAIRELIGNGEVKCFSAYTGSEAYGMLEKDFFDLIILDLGLPDMSGFDLMEKIRTNEKINKIPIVVYTGKDLKKEDNALLHKLADTVVLKTANSQERLLDETILFLHQVESTLPKEKQTLIRKLHKRDEILKDKRVLLVDDDMRNIYALTNALEEEGLKCVTAENGRAAIDVLRADPTLDMILMDVMMPEMDGYEATVEIRKISAFKKLPIIAMTAKAMKGDKEKCLQAGMSDYISKPLNMVQLLSLMRVWLYK